MPTREQVLGLVQAGKGYEEIAAQLGITPGQAHMIATGIAADGGDTVTPAQRARPGFVQSHAQRLVNPHEVKPVRRDDVLAWIRRRAEGDAPLQAAARARQQAQQQARQAQQAARAHAETHAETQAETHPEDGGDRGAS